VSGDNPRLLELRRRVQADPASIAFAQLAEECRRAGENDEAVGICRAGLNFHPDYLSARVTLGRALSELGRLDEAHAELFIVLTAAPDNLAANRAMAEVYQQRGQMPEALAHYKKALTLAQHDADLEHAVERIEHVVSPPAPVKAEAPALSIEDLFDFDTLLEQLGGRTQPKPEIPTPIDLSALVPSTLDKVVLPADDTDPFALLERQLRDSEAQPVREDPAIAAATRERRVIADLEDWLAAIITDRNTQASA
jgi:tetratricopeptide (TPR) repeat protein